MQSEAYTSPERCCEVTKAKRVRELMLAKGLCHFCRHRVEGFGLAACSREGLMPAVCAKRGVGDGLRFDMDHDKVREAYEEV